MLTGLYFAAYLYTPFRNPSRQVRTFVGLYEYKEEILKAVPPPRIVLIAGSNGMYGINTKKMSEVLHVPAFNECISVVMGLDYMLYSAKSYLKKGDIVLLALEYQYYIDSAINETSTGVILQRDRGYFLQLPFSKKLEWLFGEPLTGIFDGFLKSKELTPSVAAAAQRAIREHLNDHGDFIGHTKDKSTSKPEVFLAGGPINIVDIDSKMRSQKSWSSIRSFNEWCQANGIRVFATFPSTVYFSDYQTEKAAKAFQNIVDNYHSIGVQTIGTPLDFIWDASNFYDLSYHLNEEAMNERTDLLITLLAPYLQARK